MVVYRNLDEVPSDAPDCSLTIGNFDGVHLGHRHLFESVVAAGRKHGWKPSVLTFDPHPTRVVAPERAPKLLTTVEQRVSLMKDAGIEQVFLIPFDREFAALGPEQFIEQVVLERLHARAVTVGDNFRFGHRHAGDTEMLRRLADQHGFLVDVVHGITLRGRMVSSTEVRRLVQTGSVSLACRLLGHPFSLEGDVVSGHGIGSRQTVPTLNLRWESDLLPANGVYVTRTSNFERSWPSITNVGTRPTFNGSELTVETFLLSELAGAAPARIRVEFLHRIRDERRFPSPEELKAQIGSDVRRAQAYHRRTAALRNGQMPGVIG